MFCLPHRLLRAETPKGHSRCSNKEDNAVIGHHRRSFVRPSGFEPSSRVEEVKTKKEKQLHRKNARVRTSVASPAACTVHARVARPTVPPRYNPPPIHAVVVTSLLRADDVIIIMFPGGGASFNSTRVPPANDDDARATPPTLRRLVGDTTVGVDDRAVVYRCVGTNDDDDVDDDARIFDAPFAFELRTLERVRVCMCKQYDVLELKDFLHANQSSVGDAEGVTSVHAERDRGREAFVY